MQLLDKRRSLTKVARNLPNFFYHLTSRIRYAFLSIQAHYLSHGSFLLYAEGVIQNRASRLAATGCEGSGERHNLQQARPKGPGSYRQYSTVAPQPAHA